MNKILPIFLLVLLSQCKQPLYSDQTCSPVREVMYDMERLQVIETFDTNMCHCLEDQEATIKYNKYNIKYTVKCVPY